MPEELCQTKHEDLKRIIDLMVHSINIRMDGMDKALAIASREADKQYEHLNNLRANVVSSTEFAIRIEQLDKLSERIAIVETRLVTWIAALFLFLTITQVVLHIVNI